MAYILKMDCWESVEGAIIQETRNTGLQKVHLPIHWHHQDEVRSFAGES